MQRKNLFDGESHKAQFAIIAYRQLMSRKWVTNADIMAEYFGMNTQNVEEDLTAEAYVEILH